MTNMIAENIAQYILQLSNFDIIDQGNRCRYNHVGATITDAILQSGLNYNTVVLPRVQSILFDYGLFSTTTAFLSLLQIEGPEKIIRWNHPMKINRIYSLLNFMINNDLNNEDELANWLLDSHNAITLLSIKGIGPKTIDYLKLLLNIQAIAVDRHIIKFVKKAGINMTNYYEIRETLEISADILNVSWQTLDFSIWYYMSSNSLMKNC